MTTNASVSRQYSVGCLPTDRQPRALPRTTHPGAVQTRSESTGRSSGGVGSRGRLRRGASVRWRLPTACTSVHKPPEKFTDRTNRQVAIRVETPRPLCAVIAHRGRSSHLTGGLRARQVSFNVFLMVYAVVSHARCVEFTPMVMCKPAVQATVAGRVFDSFVSTGL